MSAKPKKEKVVDAKNTAVKGTAVEVTLHGDVVPSPTWMPVIEVPVAHEEVKVVLEWPDDDSMPCHYLGDEGGKRGIDQPLGDGYYRITRTLGAGFHLFRFVMPLHAKTVPGGLLTLMAVKAQGKVKFHPIRKA